MSAKLLDLRSAPLLGRIHDFNRKHRLRAKHYAAIEDWPANASVEVVPGAELDAVDHYPNTDEVFIVSDRLLQVLRAVNPDVEAFPVDAGGRTLHVVLPLTDSDVMYEAEVHPAYTVSGYSILDGHGLRVPEPPTDAFCSVRNSRLLAISPALAAAAQAAGVRWTVHDLIADYTTEPRHPYALCSAGYAGIAFGKLTATSTWPDLPARVSHPLGAYARDAEFDGDPDEAWLERLSDTDSTADAAHTRYAAGLPLPDFEASLGDVAKSRLSKRWKATLGAGFGRFKGLPFVSASMRDSLLAAGVEARFDRVPLTDPKLGKSTDLYLLTPEVVVDWIDWSRSDVGLRWNGMISKYFALEPTEASYSASAPLVRVAGTALILVHESLHTELSAELGFHLVPLHELRAARNLDDSISAT